MNLLNEINFYKLQIYESTIKILLAEHLLISALKTTSTAVCFETIKLNITLGYFGSSYRLHCTNKQYTLLEGTLSYLTMKSI